ncbi:MAG: CC/Se motif family (seleno)protein [Bacillota bacterium]|nr:CC/Se motif family (seleno)protein [Bacillota bacterium]
MKITIQDKLMEYLHEHEYKIIKLKLVHEDYSVGNVYSKRPIISYHEPNHLERYDRYEIDDIVVYIQKGIKAKNDHIEFIFEKLLGKHSCHVKGVELDKMPSETG